jgi:hypothetical protein
MYVESASVLTEAANPRLLSLSSHMLTNLCSQFSLCPYFMIKAPKLVREFQLQAGWGHMTVT